MYDIYIPYVGVCVVHNRQYTTQKAAKQHHTLHD